MSQQRRQTLQSLIWLHEPLEQISERLSEFEWDFDDEPIVLETTAVETALMRYLKGYISAQELENWAEVMESCEEIEFEAEFSEEIQMIIHLLVNPEINYGINSDLCSHFLDVLGTTTLNSFIQDLAVRSELVRVCQMMKSNWIELIYGCRKIVQLSHSLVATDQEVFLAFVGVASECEDYPDRDKKSSFLKNI